MHWSLDRFGSHGGVIPYSCVDAISYPEGDPSGIYLVTRIYCLTKSLRLLVLALLRLACSVLRLSVARSIAWACSLLRCFESIFFRCRLILSPPPLSVCPSFYALAGHDIPRTGRKGHKFQDAATEKGVIIFSGRSDRGGGKTRRASDHPSLWTPWRH